MATPMTQALQCQIIKAACPTQTIPSTCCGMAGAVSITCDANSQVTDLSFQGASCNTNFTFPLRRLTSLRTLVMSNSGFGGRFLGSVAKLPNLAALDLTNNMFEGQLPEIDGAWPNLKSLKIANSGVSLGKELTYRCTPLKDLNSEYSCIPSNVSLQNINNVSPPAVVDSGNKNDPTVTYRGPDGMAFQTAYINDPTPLIQGRYIVNQINNMRICGGTEDGWWGLLYAVDSQNPYPICSGNFGDFNGQSNNAPNGTSPLIYSTCPGTFTHDGTTDTYVQCWTGQLQNTKFTHNFENGLFTFSNNLMVGWCCFNTVPL